MKSAFFDAFLNLLFPQVCGFCEKVSPDALCTECKQKVEARLIYGIDEIKDKFFEEHLYLMRYEGEIREKILAYKFEDKSYLYHTFAKLIVNSKKICDILQTYDIITSVPIHPKRKSKRGYDQSELIAREIAKNMLNLKYEKVLKKIRDNPKQSLQSKQERIQNVKNAYEITKKEIIKDKRVVLFDDIYTTGSTVNECSRVLKQNGAKYILILSLTK